MPCDSPVCLMTSRGSLSRVLASLSPRQAQAAGLLTSGTYGPPRSTSLRSAVLAGSLASRLMRRFDTDGSILFKMTWKLSATPSQRPVFLLRASGRRTSDNASGSWPTARATDGEKNVRTLEGSLKEIERKGGPQDLNQAACLASWPTPTCGNATGSQSCEGMSATGRMDDGRKVAVSLGHVARMSASPWATPSARDWHSASGTPEFLAGRAEQTRGKPLSEQAFTLAPWPTPMAGTPAQNGNNDSSRRTVALAFGPPLDGSPVETASGGQLNPAFSLWLMGYRKEFLYSMQQGMASSRKLQRRSSKST